jgi:hypothetical protein
MDEVISQRRLSSSQISARNKFKLISLSYGSGGLLVLEICFDGLSNDQINHPIPPRPELEDVNLPFKL